MSSEIYSAAKAFFPMPGKSIEEVWKELTGMFGPDARSYRSYIVNGYSLECVKRHTPNDISFGDTFKYTTWTGTDYYVHIEQCSVYESFAFEEKMSPRREQDCEYGTMMEFFINSDKQPIWIEIRRRGKAPVSSWRERLREKVFGPDHGDSAAKLLQSIVTSTPGYNGSQWSDGETKRGDITVIRDDSYRIYF